MSYIIVGIIACIVCLFYHMYITKLCPPTKILAILDEMLRKDFSDRIDAKVFILWALFRAYFYGESDYTYWHDAFMADKTTVSNELCNDYLLQIHNELNNIIKFYKYDKTERQKIELIKMHLNLYFHFKTKRMVRVK